MVPQPGPGILLPERKRKKPVPLEEEGKESEIERQRRYTFAELMRRVPNINVLRGPFCSGKRKLIALITEAQVIRAILECLDLPVDPPEVMPARWPP